MEQEQNPLDMPVHIVNGFSFRESSAQLMAFALDVVRLGGKIEESFWNDHIVESIDKQDLIDLIHITGPVIPRAQFDLFESLDQCRKNAHTLLEALIYGFDLLMQELNTAFLEEGGASHLIRRHKTNMFSRDLIQYLTRPAEEKDIHLLHAYRRQAAALCDAEPVVLGIHTTDSNQFVWNGEWRALLTQSEEVRQRHLSNWYFNHALTEHRLKVLVGAYLRHKFPEQFGGKNA